MAAKNKTAMSPEEKYKLITRNLQMAFNGAVFEAQINASLGLDVGHLPKKRSYPREHSANETLGPAEKGKSCQSGNGLKRLFLHLWGCLLCISSCSASPVLDRRADDLCVYAVIYDSEMFYYMKSVIYMPMLVSHDIHCEARKGRIVFELKSLSREDSWFKPVYARNTKLSHHLVLLEQATSRATRWYSDIENGYYEEDGNIFCVDVPTKPCKCVYNICENKHLMRPASSFGTRSDTLTLKEYTHGLQQIDKVKHKGGVALWVLKIIHNGVRSIKVKYKEILTNSEVSLQCSGLCSLQCSGLCEIWNIIGTNSNDFHTHTDNKWIIHMVISFMTLFMTKTKFSGVLSTSSNRKLSRGFVILFLTVCIFETSSATGHNAFKSLALKSEREGQGPIKRLVQIKISENADVDLCCRICKPCIMKMSCDIFCKKPCPKENVAMKSNSENQHNSDVLKWIPIISAANQTIEYSINQSSNTPLIIPSLISSERSARQSASLPDELALSKFEQAKTSNMTKPEDNPLKQQNTSKAAIHQTAGYCLVMAKVKNQTSEWRFDKATNVDEQLSVILEAIAFQILTTMALVQIWWNQKDLTPKTSFTETRSDFWRIRYWILKAYICLMNTVLVESSQNGFVNVQCLRCNEICDPTVVKQSCQSYCKSLCKFDYTKALTLSAYLWIILLVVTGLCVLTRYQKKSFYLKGDFGKSTQTYDNQPTVIVVEHYQTQLDPEKVTRTHNGVESHSIRATAPIPPQTCKQSMNVLSCNGQGTDITQPMCYQELESVNHEVLLSTNITESTTEASEVNAPDNLNRPQSSDRRVSVSSTENTFESALVQTQYEDNGSIFTEMDSLGGRTISQESQSVDTNDKDVLNNRHLTTNNAISSFLQLEKNGTTQKIENIGNCLPLSSSALPIRSEDETYISNDSTDNIDINRNTEFNCDQEKKLIKSFRIHVTQQLPVEASTFSREFLKVYNKLSEHNNADRKGENEDDCHALRQVTWLSGEHLPIPSLDYTVAIVHSEAQRILERLAKGEHIGAHESMRYEILRVCTFRNYPGDGKPFRIQLASAGWYFASDSDEVVCYCCGLRKSGWKEIDNPMKIHELLRPTCDYLVKRSEVNIPIPELPEERAAKFNIFESNTPDSTIQSRQGERASNFDSDSSNPQDRFYTPPPKHPQYAEISTRLETFKKWPTNIPQTAQIMADCGYYYAGFGDCVRCFHCGIGLRHWTEDDYPWVEHARWSKNCAYLRLKKGIEFIQNVHLAIDNDEEPEDLVPETPSGRPADMSQAIPNEDSSQILLTDPAQSVLTMGYQPRIIKRAIDIILQKDGKPGITAQKIMETIFMLEERDAAVTSNLQEGLAKINISSASGGPDTQLKEAPNTSGGNAAIGQAHGRARTQGNDKAKKDQQKDVKHSSKEKRNDKEESNKKESNKAPQKHNEATAHSEEGGGSESKSKVKDTNKIKAENRKLKEQTVCKICLDKPVSIVFLPCGHLVTCAECAPAMRKCPICRALVKGRVKAFMS